MSQNPSSKRVFDDLTNIQWLPDGNQISFVYQRTLYVMPATLEQ